MSGLDHNDKTKLERKEYYLKPKRKYINVAKTDTVTRQAAHRAYRRDI